MRISCIVFSQNITTNDVWLSQVDQASMSANSRVKCVPLITTGSSQKHSASGRAGAILMMYNEGTSLCPREGFCAFHIKRLKEITIVSTEQRHDI